MQYDYKHYSGSFSMKDCDCCGTKNCASTYVGGQYQCEKCCGMKKSETNIGVPVSWLNRPNESIVAEIEAVKTVRDMLTEPSSIEQFIERLKRFSNRYDLLLKKMKSGAHMPMLKSLEHAVFISIALMNAQPTKKSRKMIESLFIMFDPMLDDL